MVKASTIRDLPKTPHDIVGAFLRDIGDEFRIDLALTEEGTAALTLVHGDESPMRLRFGFEVPPWKTTFFIFCHEFLQLDEIRNEENKQKTKEAFLKLDLRMKATKRLVGKGIGKNQNTGCEEFYLHIEENPQGMDSEDFRNLLNEFMDVGTHCAEELRKAAGLNLAESEANGSSQQGRGDEGHRLGSE